MQFEERVIKAVELLWVTQDKDLAEEAKELLKAAAREGNADANYFLARCYAGPSYINKAYGFQEDIKMAEQYLEKSLELGSTIGMIGARRFEQFRPYKGTLIYPPYNSNREIWDAIIELSRQEVNAVTLFCKYLVGNAYYYGDIVEMVGFPEDEIDEETKKAFMLEAARNYEECLRQGGTFAAGNLIQIYESGEVLPKDSLKVIKYKEMAADLNVGKYQVDVGDYYLDSDVDKAEDYYIRAEKNKIALGFSRRMKLYSFGGKRPRDLIKAVEIANAGLELEPEHPGLHNYLGEIYFYGGDGIEVDYYKAIRHFEQAYVKNNWCADLLGICCLRGWGTDINFERAKSLFLEKPSSRLCLLGLGEIYCFGLGVNQDIAKGMDYLDKKSSEEASVDMKSYFKKSLLGKWKQVKDYQPFSYK